MIDTKRIAEYYKKKLKVYGDSPQAADWKDKASQDLRFSIIADFLPAEGTAFSLLDYGCGNGDFYLYARAHGMNIKKYLGIDICDEMIDFCKKKFSANQNGAFFGAIPVKAKTDYAVACGTLTVKLKHSSKEWLAHTLKTIDELMAHAKVALIFTMMTSHVDFRASHLFYMNPAKLLDLLIKKYRRVDLIHSYPLYEYTVCIKK